MAASDLGQRIPARAKVWKLRTRTLACERPLLMGILNVTPDSFSDGGKFLEHEEAIQQAFQLLDDGADIVDIGGESTRPYSTPVSVDEEQSRVLPVIEDVLQQRPNAILSIDTSKAKIARAAIAAGAQIVNDVTALGGDRRMKYVVRETGAGVCLMHMQQLPQTMQDDPQYEDVVGEIHEFLECRRNDIIQFGIEPERICLDPGIGFGKTHEHNLTLMANCWRFHDLGCPLLVGHSRKGFLGKLIGDKSADRTAATIGGALALATQGVQILRVHDVRPVRDALMVFAAASPQPLVP